MVPAPETAPGSRALVTGCAGFIGSHLSEGLLDRGVEVVGVDCFTDYYPRVRKETNLARLRERAGFSLYELDLSADPLDELVEGIDTVYHLAAQPGVRGSFGDGFEYYVRNNVLATQRLLEALVRGGAFDATFVYASSSSVYGDSDRFPLGEDDPRRPLSPYGMTKLATEELAGVYERNAGLRTVGLRYFTVYGPRQRPDMAFTKFLDLALAGEPITVYGDGSQIRDFTYVADAVEGTIAAAAHGAPGSVYNVGGGSQVALREAIDLIGELLERPIEVAYLPAARGDVRRTCSDPERARRELGFLPRVPFEVGLERQVEWALERRPASIAGVLAA